MGTGEADFTAEWTNPKQVTADGKTKWRVDIKICNKTGKDANIKIMDNPYFGGPNKLYKNDKDSTGKPIPGSGNKKALAATKKISIKKDECHTETYLYDARPDYAYTDIYHLKENGETPEDKPAKGSNWTHIFESKEVGSIIPSGENRFFAYAFPIPYPMALEKVWPEPIEVMIDNIEGLPPGFDFVTSYPPLGEPYRLDFADRDSTACIVLRQRETLPEGAVYMVKFDLRIISPEELNWPSRVSTFYMINDKTPPEILIANYNINDQSLDIMLDVADKCAGVGEITLNILYQDKWLSLEPEIIEASRYFTQVRFKANLIAGYSKLILSLKDGVDNESILDITKFND